MVLNIREKQKDALLRMLHFNAAPPGRPGAGAPEGDDFKVLVLDRSTQDVVAPLLRVAELRAAGVTLHLPLDAERQPIPDVPAIYFVAPTEDAVARIVADASLGLYDCAHVNFSSHVPRPLLERLAAGAVAGGAAARLASVHDQHAAFAALEGGLFSLNQPDAYVRLNDPTADEAAVNAAVAAVVDGLFCALATLGVVPVIRAPRGGAADHVAQRLDARLRDALRPRSNLFTEAAGAAGGAGAAAPPRPLLALFDRSFELSVVLQHAWTYKPLVHDLLGLRLNRAEVPDGAGAGGPSPPGRRAVDVGDDDFFWAAHGREQFPRVAEAVESELAKYRAAVDELSRRAGGGAAPDGSSAGAAAAGAPPPDAGAATRGLLSAVSSLPELTERKRVLDKHTNVATALLREIKARAVDQLYALEEELVAGKAGLPEVLKALAAPEHGGPADRARLALVWLLTAEAAPGDAECAQVEAALAAAGADAAAWAYARRMRRLNLTGRQQGQAPGGGGAGAGAGGAGDSQLTSLLGSTFGAGLTSLTRGVKNLLAGEQQAAVTVAVEALMDPARAAAGGAPDAGAEFATYDPRAPAGAPARPPPGGFREAIVFMVGGGNYLEAESLGCWAARAQPAPRHVVYGATELLSGEQFLGQLAELGRKSGAAR